MSQIIVLILAVLLIGFILWWFFGKHEVSTASSVVSGNSQSANVIVNGGYNPAVLVLKKGVPATLIFNRKDPSTCLEKVVFPDFGINQDLPQNKDVALNIDTSEAGEYEYACGMNMFHGKIIVK